MPNPTVTLIRCADYSEAKIAEAITRNFELLGGLDKFVGPWKDFTHAVAAFALVWLILFWMYRKKSFIKV